MPPSRVGTIDPLDTTTRVYVNADLKEVGAGSTDAAFVYKRHDLDRVVARRKELGLGGDEALRVNRESQKVALAAAERRAAAAEAEAETLRSRIAASEKQDAKAK